MINMVVGEAITGLSPKDKVTKGMLLTKMNSINEKIITKLFVPPVDPDEDEDNGTYLVDSDEEFEPEDHSGGLKPYLHVRGRLEALLRRPLLFELAELGCNRVVEGRDWFGVWSRGEFFPMILARELERLSQ